jgi:hypothetical protein
MIVILHAIRLQDAIGRSRTLIPLLAKLPVHVRADVVDGSNTFHSVMRMQTRQCRRVLLSAIFASLAVVSATRATDPPCPVTLAQLKKLGVCELDRLFEQAPAGEVPHGPARGRVLVMADARMPKVRACLASSMWKGKNFDDDGTFINQWPGFQALRGNAEPGTSWHDGKPCLVLDYPANTPLFGNTRDELRQVGPGLYLVRLYERCPYPHFRGYLVISTCAAAI